MQTQSIQDLTELVSDERAYPARNGHRDPASPAWIFRDEKGQEDSDVLWGRDLALDFEEWKAKQEQKAQYLKGELLPAFIPTDSRKGIDFILATMSEIEEWMNKPTKDKKPIMVKRDEEGVLHEWSPKTEAEAEAYFGRQDNRELCNWLIGWHKRRPANNDNWRRFIAPLADVLDHPQHGKDAQTILKGLRDALPFAPGPVKETVFINPDKSRVVTRLSPGTAKAGYVSRHGISGDLVTMDRVQYEGERTSRYVIGTRKASDKTASSYYDADPVMGDKGYVPRACILMRLDPKSPIMPDSSCYRLTVRELERAIIAGADLCEDDLDALACSFENQDSQFDTREGGLSFDDSCDFRTMLDLNEQEAWLYWQLWGAGLESACQAMMVATCHDIARFLPGLDGAMLKLGTDEELTDDEEIAAAMLESARQEDLLELDKTGRVQFSRYDYLRALGNGESHHANKIMVESYSTAVAHFDDETDSWAIPTQEGSRLCKFRNWK